MSRRLLIAPYLATELAELDGTQYVAAIASVGYEPRSIAIAEALGDACRSTAVEFPQSHVLAYEENRSRYEQLGWKTVLYDDAEFLSWVRGRLVKLAADETRERGQCPRVAVDISSMTRTRIAAVVQALDELPAHLKLGADLIYAPATYRPPELPPPAILRRAPVSAYFAGSIAMDRTTVVLGLGYEQHKAASTIEDFGPEDVVAFVPEGRDPRFLDAVMQANSGVLDGPLKPRQTRYPLEDPFATFQRLEALCFDLRYREDAKMPVLVPLGPKIFAACCLLVGALHRDDVAVWRVSYREDEPPAPAQAAGEVLGLRVDVPLLSDS